MKIFHTADWHLGKLVQGVSMVEDQRYILQQFILDVATEKPDVVIVAGDLFDRAVAPVEAVNVLNEVLAELVLKLNTPVLCIAGNHDSPGRIEFGSSLMRASGLHMVGHLPSDFQPVVLQDTFGEVHFHLIPFVEPTQVRHHFQDDAIQTYQEAMQKLIEYISERLDKNARHVLIGHAFVTKFGQQEENTSDSERPLAIGGSECVDAALFEKFHYTALGHLHQAHFVLNERIQYAGSPLKYSMSEHNHQKGYLIIELDEQGNVEVEKRQLLPRRDLRIVEGKMDDLLKLPISEDYVFIRLTDENPVLSAMERIRTVFPNIMHIARKVERSVNENDVQIETMKRDSMDDLSLFQAFYKEITGNAPKVTTEALFKEVLQELLQDERELVKEA